MFCGHWGVSVAIGCPASQSRTEPHRHVIVLLMRSFAKVVEEGEQRRGTRRWGGVNYFPLADVWNGLFVSNLNIRIEGNAHPGTLVKFVDIYPHGNVF